MKPHEIGLWVSLATAIVALVAWTALGTAVWWMA